MKKYRSKLLLVTTAFIFIGGVLLSSNLYFNDYLSYARNEETKIVVNRDNTDKTVKKRIGEAERTKKKISILFLGDLMFDRYIRQTAQKKGNDYIFEKISDILLKEDLVVANLEGPITNNNSKSIDTLPGQPGHFVFTFDPGLAETLAKKNIKLVNIGNNHILNFDVDGIAQTKENLEKNEIEYFGDIGNGNDYLVENINQAAIGLINYNQFTSGSPERTLEAVRSVRDRVDCVVVFTHWGTEYRTEPSQNIINMGHKFIDEGADLVIGTHPHVTQPMEEYRGKRIYYSLGNFVFDQYFSAETKKGMAVEVKITPGSNSMEFKEINLSLENNGQTIIK